MSSSRNRRFFQISGDSVIMLISIDLTFDRKGQPPKLKIGVAQDEGITEVLASYLRLPSLSTALARTFWAGLSSCVNTLN